MTIETIIDEAAAEIRCDPRAVWALAQVESSGGKALHRFERHKFHELTGKRARTYAAACALDPEAAAMASSWGVFHVLGKWYQFLGYASAREMASALSSIGNVTAQIASVVDYCSRVAPGAGPALRALDAQALALAYNGSKGVEWGYHIKWHAALARAGGSAAVVLRVGDEGRAVRELQDTLIARGYDAITADGHFGQRTQEAVIALQQRLGLAVDGVVGNKTWRALDRPMTRPPPSAGDRVEVAVRDAPGTTVGISGLITTILGYLGWPEAADFVHRLAGGDFGWVGDAIMRALPFLFAGCLALVTILCIAYIIREVRNGRQDQAIARRLDPRRVARQPGKRPHEGPVVPVRGPDDQDLRERGADRTGAGRPDPAWGGRGGLFRDRRAGPAPGVLRPSVERPGDDVPPFTIG